jgi:putative FmdB family regulatory protein
VPTYQYACTACGHQLEAVQSFAEDPLTECPACAGRLRKLFSSVGIVFKGSGFYRTDSRGSTGSKTEKSEPAAKPAAESKPKTETKTEAKPASAPAA